MLYLLQATVYSGILYAVYLMLLRNHATHAWNRAYLLLCTTLPFVMPLINIPNISAPNLIKASMFEILLPELKIKSATGILQTWHILSPSMIFTIIYVSGSITLLTILVFQILKFSRFIYGKSHKTIANNIKVITQCGYGPGSFGNYIFFPEEEINTEILHHELAHVQYHHTRDVIYTRLLQCLFWPNPMLHLIIKELKTIHEFQADEAIVTNRDIYIAALLNNIFQTRRFTIAHTFFHHPIKRRIIMLQKTNQSRSKMRSTIIRSGIIATSLIAGVIYLQSCKQESKQDVLNASNNAAPALPKEGVTKDGKTYEYVEHMPISTVDIPEFLGANIKYPEYALKNKIEGRVLVKFIVDKEGNVTNPEVLRSPDQSLSDEAIRVIKTMPKWTPGNNKGENVAVYFTIPISFKL